MNVPPDGGTDGSNAASFRVARCRVKCRHAGRLTRIKMCSAALRSPGWS
jgi:hypothetical protein